MRLNNTDFWNIYANEAVGHASYSITDGIIIINCLEWEPRI